MKYTHTNIIAEDWKKLADFYIEVFNCKVVPPFRKQSGDWLSKGTGVKNAGLEGAHLRLPGHGDHGPTLEIYSYMTMLKNSIPQPNRVGLGHLAFEVDDVAQVLDLVIQHGGTVNGEIVQRSVEGVGVITFVYVRDPEGNLIELQNWK